MDGTLFFFILAWVTPSLQLLCWTEAGSQRFAPFLHFSSTERKTRENMGFFSFLGRLLFASFFLLSAWQM